MLAIQGQWSSGFALVQVVPNQTILKYFVVVLCCLVSVTFHLSSVHIIYISVSVAELPPFGK